MLSVYSVDSVAIIYCGFAPLRLCASNIFTLDVIKEGAGR